jgi:hypothetical protein
MTTEATSGFMIFDLRKIVPGRGIKLSGCPYFVATDGDPTFGTATGAPGERLFGFSSREFEHEEEIFLKGLHLYDSKIYWGHDGNGTRLKFPAGILISVTVGTNILPAIPAVYGPGMIADRRPSVLRRGPSVARRSGSGGQQAPIRTAGFPQYSWKFGRPDGAFTRRLLGNFVSRGWHPSFAHLAACSVVSPFRAGFAPDNTFSIGTATEKSLRFACSFSLWVLNCVP